MILPIVAYGDPVLRRVGVEVTPDFPNLENLISNMKETMHNASGVGLAAPQIGKAIRLFIIDASPFAEDDDVSEDEKKVLQNFNRVFINPKIVKEEGEEWIFNEGCLSIPDVRENVSRKPVVTIKYQDENFDTQTEVLDGLAARVFQHEYDHIEGILFTDKLSPLKKRIIKKKLTNITNGKIRAAYRLRFPNLKNVK